ncbi:MAG: molybdopterin-dependent oxidoreductase [Chloroflexi bacterium]|nr:molybdopterin-dependent oxidoreductase [Chloroflexota bacterium]
MGLTRRRFLQWAGATGIGAVVFNGCRVPDHEIQVQSPVQIPEDLVTGRDNYYATVIQGPSSSEGLLVRVMEGRAKKVEGNPDYPMNTGKHGLRAEALLQAAYHPDRIKTPLRRVAKGGPYRPIGWPEAIGELTRVLNEADPSRVVLATAPIRGVLADVTHRFADSYGARLIGFDPLDQTVLRAAMKRVFGQDALPDFDIARTGYLLSFGSDFLGTWLDPTHFARGYGEFRQGDGERGYLVQVDSRFSPTAAAADQWVYVTPGSEGLLAMAMIHTIVSDGLGDGAAASALTGGRGASALSAFTPSAVAERVFGETGGGAERIRKMARDFASKEHGQALAIGGGSAGAYANGLFNLTAIYALNHLVGAVDPPNGGGLVFNPPSDEPRITAAPLREWKQLIGDMRAGNVDVLLVRDANIDYGLPGSLGTREALGKVGTIVSFSSFLDETTVLADLILPGSTPLEEWGTDIPDPGPGYRTVAFQQPVINPFHGTLSFGDVLLQTGRELGFGDQLPWATMRDAVRDTARALHETGGGSVTQPTFPEFWKRALERGGWWDMNATAGAASAPPRLPTATVLPKLAGDENQYPFFLVPYEAHGIGAGGFAHLPWVQSAPDPITTVAWATWVDVNPTTARELNLHQDDIVIVGAPNGRFLEAAVYVNPATPPHVVSIPFGGGHEHFTGVAAKRGANVLDILEDSEDTETGALAWAGTRVRLTKTRNRVKLPKLEGNELAVQLPGEEVIEVQHVSR